MVREIQELEVNLWMPGIEVVVVYSGSSTCAGDRRRTEPSGWRFGEEGRRSWCAWASGAREEGGSAGYLSILGRRVAVRGEVTSPASMAGGWMGMPKVEVVGAIYSPEEGEEEHLGEGMGFS